ASSTLELESRRSKRVCISFSACWMALLSSCMSILLTMSKELSAAIGIYAISSCYKSFNHKGHKGHEGWLLLAFQIEEAAEVRRGGFCDGFDRDATDLGDLLGGLDDVGGFVALAAVGNRCEVGRISLDEDAVKRALAGGGADVFRFREGHRAGERDDEAEF